jgi:deferrochelatase/peroxidase EfeB
MSILGSGKSFPSLDSAIRSSVQGIVKTGYKNCSRRTYYLRLDFSLTFGSLSTSNGQLQVIEALKSGTLLLEKGSQQRFLLGLVNRILSLQHSQCECALDIAFTHQGLHKLKVHSDVLDAFRQKSPAFYDNAYRRAVHHLGDSGLSNPENWLDPFRDSNQKPGIDLVLVTHCSLDETDLVFKKNEVLSTDFERSLFDTVLKSQVVEHRSFPRFPLTCSWIEDSMPLPTPGQVHFGFKDGLTFPVYKVNPTPEDKGFRAEHALGEILLGHPKNDGENPYAGLPITKKAYPDFSLRETPKEQEFCDFFKNSSFGVFRTIRQDTAYFESWLTEQAKARFNPDKALGFSESATDPYALSKRWLKAKMLGRTPAGRLMTPDITMADLTSIAEAAWLAANSNFVGQEQGFHQVDSHFVPPKPNDAQGKGCPFSSHIRRMNPRDDSVTPFIHRPLLRRSMPYARDEDHGLSGLFFCADLVEQFEHLVGRWADQTVLGIPDDSDCKDPIIGNHEPQKNTLYLESFHQTNKAASLQFDRSFCETQGTVYTWFPSLSVLERMSRHGMFLSAS